MSEAASSAGSASPGSSAPPGSASAPRERRDVLAAAGRAALACVLLTIMTVLRRSLPMRRLALVVGKAQPASRTLEKPPPPRGLDQEVARAVDTAARRLPLTTTCLDQALAGSLLLRLRGRRSTLVIGMAKDHPRGGTHAWLVATSGSVVVGASEMEDFTPVTQFVRDGSG